MDVEEEAEESEDVQQMERLKNILNGPRERLG